MKILLPCLYLTFVVLSPLIPILSQAVYAREAEIDSATPDLAFGAYQRGDFKVAMLEAKKTANKSKRFSSAGFDRTIIYRRRWG